MLYISTEIYSDALDVCAATPRRRLHGCDRITGPHGAHIWHLANVLPTITPTQFEHIPALVNAAVIVPAAPMPPAPEIVSDKLVNWANARHRTNMRENALWGASMQRVQRQFAQTLADHLCTPAIMQKAEYLRRIILIDPAILRHVFAAHELPQDFTIYAINFALGNMTANTNHNPPPLRNYYQ